MAEDPNPAPAADEDEAPLERLPMAVWWHQGHTYALFIGLIALSMLAAPTLNRLLESYSAVIVALPTEERPQVTLLLHNGMLEGREISEGLAQTLTIGDYLNKEAGRWDPAPTPLEALPDRPDIEEPDRQPRRYLPPTYAKLMSHWKGQIVELPEGEEADIDDLTLFAGFFASTLSPTLVVRVDAETTRKVQVSPELFPRLGVGDVLEKRPGEWYPRRIARAAPSARPAALPARGAAIQTRGVAVEAPSAPPPEPPSP